MDSSASLLLSFSLPSLSLPDSSPPHLVPTFPVEIQRYILSFASPGTLALCCRVSVSFLEMASEFLCLDVEVKGKERLAHFFDKMRMSSSARIEPFLSLSRLRTFTFVEIPSDTFPLSDLPQPPNSSLFLVDRLTIKHTPPKTNPSLSKHIETQLLRSFNPITFVLASLPPYAKRSYAVVPGIYHEGSQWDRLQHVRLVHTRSYISPRDLFDRSNTSLRWTLTHEVPLPFHNGGVESRVLLGAMLNFLVLPRNPVVPGEEDRDDRGVIVVPSEEERKRVEKRLLELSHLTIGSDEKRRSKTMALLSVVVGEMPA